MNIVVFTGAGVSRESGLKTFRDEDGLWEGRRVEDVCTTRAWRMQPDVVLDFYNARRREVAAAQPNAAHRAIAALEGPGRRVAVITQNIDDLHERAGSTGVLHLHGLITKMHGAGSEQMADCAGDIALGDLDPQGRQYRPHVVFFGEDVPNMAPAYQFAAEADFMLVVGSTLAVYPAAGVVETTTASRIWIVDPRFPDNANVQRRYAAGQVRYIAEPATLGTPLAVEEITGACASRAPSDRG